MDQGPLLIQQVEAGKRLVDEFNNYKPVRAAFWLLAAESPRWYLYLASDEIDDSNFDLAYGEVIRITAAAPNPWLDPFHVKVIGSSAPLARAVIDIQAKYPAQIPMRYRGGRMDGITVDEAYIYSPPATAKA